MIYMICAHDLAHVILRWICTVQISVQHLVTAGIQNPDDVDRDPSEMCALFTTPGELVPVSHMPPTGHTKQGTNTDSV